MKRSNILQKDVNVAEFLSQQAGKKLKHQLDRFTAESEKLWVQMKCQKCGWSFKSNLICKEYKNNHQGWRKNKPESYKSHVTFKGREYKRIYGSVNYEITRNSSFLFESSAK